MKIDYKDLLKKYIKHVYEVEESMFLPSLVHDPAKPGYFTEEEKKELERLSEESRE